MTATRTLLPLTALAGLLVLSACGDDQPADVASPPPAPTTSAAPTVSFREDLPTAAPMRATQTLEGTVKAGVEGGCKVLSSGGTSWLLLGEVPSDALGKPVKVVGRAAPGAVTTCMQGTPFRVESVTVG